jgi:hypothetical protein
MTTELVLLYLFIGGLIGALITPLVYWAKGRKPASGFFAGVVTGAVGNLLLLLPLWILLPRRRVVSPFDFNIGVAFQMGVAAAAGGRNEEARYYFTQVTRADPRQVRAWLYLAHLATSPLEAWGYVEQARAIDPSNPQVVDAVEVVWPQVRGMYGYGDVSKPM